MPPKRRFAGRETQMHLFWLIGRHWSTPIASIHLQEACPGPWGLWAMAQSNTQNCSDRLGLDSGPRVMATTQPHGEN